MRGFMQIRQGDVLLETIPKLPEGVQPTGASLLVVGEAPGHGHYATGASKVYQKDDDLYVQVYGAAAIEHLKTDSLAHTGEHARIELPEGCFVVVQQRQYNPFSERRGKRDFPVWD